MNYLESIKKSVKDIRALRGDDEAAHAREDCLYEEILRNLAGELDFSREELRDIAKEALKTKEIDFARWCA